MFPISANELSIGWQHPWRSCTVAFLSPCNAQWVKRSEEYSHKYTNTCMHMPCPGMCVKLFTSLTTLSLFANICGENRESKRRCCSCLSTLIRAHTDAVVRRWLRSRRLNCSPAVPPLVDSHSPNQLTYWAQCDKRSAC